MSTCKISRTEFPIQDILLVITSINKICLRRVSIIFKSVKRTQRPASLRTPNKADLALSVHTSECFQNYFPKSICCVLSLHSSTILQNLQNEDQCSFIWKTIQGYRTKHDSQNFLHFYATPLLTQFYLSSMKSLFIPQDLVQ